ncbi:MAG: hypothetical protein M3071_03145 [Actinomycetota bacterium]|nr:hypothetical protein [Actinomycetota bacterium]
MPPRKCVSMGNAGAFPVPLPGGSPVADLYAGVTTDGAYNLTYFGPSRTNSPWVRLFVEWNFLWPKAPTQLASGTDPKKSRYRSPPPDQALLDNLDRNIQLARSVGLKIILTTIGFPSWANRSVIPAGTPANKDEFVFPPDSVLVPATSTPPNGSAFQPSDFMYSLWVHELMFRYHPAAPHTAGISIDALEVVNEPNVQAVQNTKSTNYRSTALMMMTAQRVKSSLNKRHKGKQPIRLLGPATADTPGAWRRFTMSLISALKAPITFGKQTYHFDATDHAFGWSHHNYNDVEQIANMFAALPAAVRQGILQLQHPEAYFALFYGTRTQQIRTLLRGTGTTSWWNGWGQQAAPRLWLTEGGCRLEKITGYPGVDPTTTYSSTGVPNDPVPGFKQLQSWALAGAAHALSQTAPGQAGRGIEMFTNFLFYDEPPFSSAGSLIGNFSGLLDHYVTNASGQPTETAAQEARIALFAWALFGTDTPR